MANSTTKVKTTSKGSNSAKLPVRCSKKWLTCTKDLYHFMDGRLDFTAGKRYEVVQQSEVDATLINNSGDTHYVSSGGWLPFFIAS